MIMDIQGTNNAPQEQRVRIKLRNSNTRRVELFIWIFVAIMELVPDFIYFAEIIVGSDDIGYEFARFLFGDFQGYNKLLIGILIILLPIIFNLVFGKLPVEFLRSRVDKTHEVDIRGSNDIDATIDNTGGEGESDNHIIQCIDESRSISERIFTRSGAYLFAGCLIAFIGVTVFYSPVFSKNDSTEVFQRLLDYLPRIGALFFIEFIAIFFFKTISDYA
jgi:hypothetical protein